MHSKFAPGLSVGKSQIDGRGCFATAFFPKGRKIAEYAGELISRREVARRVRTRRKHRICAVNN
jgi:SET domain-containing protein